MIISLLQSGPQDEASPDHDNSNTDEILRQVTLLLLRLNYAKAQNELSSSEQELELLRNAPPPPPSHSPSDDPRKAKGKEQEDMWKLDSRIPTGGPDGRGPLLDSSGKVGPCRHVTVWFIVDSTFPTASSAIHYSTSWCLGPYKTPSSGLPTRP